MSLINALIIAAATNACKRIDATFLNDELDMLTYRWKVHGTFFDKMYVFEAKETFMGHPKPLYAEKATGKRNNTKIVTTPSFAHLKHVRFAIEHATRSFAWHHIKKDPCVDNNTVIYLSDVDELIDQSRAAQHFSDIAERKSCLSVPQLMTNYNAKCYYPLLKWKYAVAGTVQSPMNTCHRYCLGVCDSKNNTPLGWHMSNHLPVKQLTKKLKSYSHANDAFVKRVLAENAEEKIKKRAAMCTDLYAREKERPELKMKRMKTDFGGYTPHVTGWPELNIQKAPNSTP